MSSLSSTPWQKNITTVSSAPVYAMKMALGQVQPAVCTTGNFRALGRSLHRELTLVIEFICQVSSGIDRCGSGAVSTSAASEYTSRNREPFLRREGLMVVISDPGKRMNG
eukprot:4511402-Amphidinium_carterae.1